MYISDFIVVCVATDVLYMCLIYVKGIKNKIKIKINKKKKIRHEENNKIRPPPRKKTELKKSSQ